MQRMADKRSASAVIHKRFRFGMRSAGMHCAYWTYDLLAQKNAREAKLLHGRFCYCSLRLGGQQALDLGQSGREHGQILRGVVLEFVDHTVSIAGGDFVAFGATLQKLLPQAANFAG